MIVIIVLIKIVVQAAMAPLILEYWIKTLTAVCLSLATSTIQLKYAQNAQVYVPNATLLPYAHAVLRGSIFELTTSVIMLVNRLQLHVLHILR